MALYVPGIQDYVPEIQPFQPDYNFLNNVLQTKQGMYDQNYSKLNSTYGKLLYSPLSRQDTTQKRDDFFKAIDGDIKRISGMDLSLQQNVDAANKVFDSFFQNKDIFYDMAFTKEHNRQIQIGDAYKNCINQEDCGGKYWDTGMQALNYKMKEFKDAPLDQAMKITNIDYTPFVNIQEKATKYLGDLLGSKGGFGVTTVGHDQSGRFLVSLTNGQNILAPFGSLLYTQYSQDPDIKRMFQTKSYVDRKNYIQQYAPTYGSEDAAEDKWFEIMRDDFTASAKRNIDVQLQKLGSQARYQLLLKTLKDEGSTGDDSLADDVVNSSIVSDLDTKVADLYQKVLDSTVNMFQNGASRDMKRIIADGYHSDKLLRNAIDSAVINSVSMTGTEEWKEDPYVKSDYEFGHDMAKQADSFARQKDLYEWQADVDIRKDLALGKVKNPDGTKELPPSGIGDEKGMSASNIDEFNDIQVKFGTVTKELTNDYAEFTSGYYSTLKNIILNDKADPQDKLLAKSTLIKIFGKYVIAKKGSVDGPYIDPVTNDPDFNAADAAANGRDRIPYGNKVVHAGWDDKTNSFRDKNGKKIESTEDFKNFFIDNYGNNDLVSYYKKTKEQMNLNKNIQAQKPYITRGDVQQLSENIDKNEKVLDATKTLFRNNTKNIKSQLRTNLGALDDTPTLNGGITERDASDLFFKDDNTIVTKDEFIKRYVNKFKNLYVKKVAPINSGGMAQTQVASGTGYGMSSSTQLDPAQDASKFYDSLHNKFKTVYNSGVVVTNRSGEKVRLVKAMDQDPNTGGGPGGASAKALAFNFSSQALNSSQTQGAITFINDALFSQNLLGNIGSPVNEQSDLNNDGNTMSDIKSAMTQMKASLMAGDKKLNGFGSYLNVALSDRNIKGMKIVLPTDYLQQFVGKNKTETWANRLLNQGGVFTTYIPKSDVKTSTFVKSHKQGDYDFIANVKPIEIDVPGGGKVTIEKKTQDGSVYVNGSIDVLKPDGTQGTPISFFNHYPAGTSIDNLVTSLRAHFNFNLQTIKQTISAIKENRPPQDVINNEFQLKQVKTRLNELAGDDPTPPGALERFYNPGLLQNGR